MTENNGARTATVQALTAEVRVLMVGSRQITMSVYNQLDWADIVELKGEPFGRVHPRNPEPHTLYTVGRHKSTGALVRCQLIDPWRIQKAAQNRNYRYGGLDDTQLEWGPQQLIAKHLAKTNSYGDPDWSNHGWGYMSWEGAMDIWPNITLLPLIVLAGLR